LFFYCFKIYSFEKAKDARQVWKYHQRLDMKKAGFSVEEQIEIENHREKG
jgi:hypothetical protein